MSSQEPLSFADFGLSPEIVSAVDEVGYETPSPIQVEAIGALLEGRDILGQAQTGTGKTAAFALPLLSRLDLSQRLPQILVLTPTRELAIQVSEAFQTYARHLPGFHVLPVYGGQSLSLQLRPLRRGVHVVVGTPGRVLDHLRRKTLTLQSLSAVVLDEADEMLRMGFIEDVGTILEQTPAEKQLALFSATMPEPIRAIARRHTRKPVEIRIKTSTATVSTVSQRYWQVTGTHKLDALTRILEVEDFDAMLIFVRTKVTTSELAERLEARGLSCAALNGDMNQQAREQTVERLRKGRLDILVATDVAARGLDVDRISHVVNYDIPYDTEAYVHRVGRTARAGRKGEAILFVAPRERRMLRAIENATGQTITPMTIPSHEDVADRRTARFKAKISDVIESQDLAVFESLVTSYQSEHNVDLGEIAAALAFMTEDGQLLSTPPKVGKRNSRGTASAPERAVAEHPRSRADKPRSGENGSRSRARKPRMGEAQPPARAEKSRTREAQSPTRVEKSPERDAQPLTLAEQPRAGEDALRIKKVSTEFTQEQREARKSGVPRREQETEKRRARDARLPDAGSLRYRIEVGETHGVEAKNIVGAIANEAGLDSEYIGAISIHAEHSTVDLPSGMPKEVFKHLKQVWVCGRRLMITHVPVMPAKTAQSRSAKRQSKPDSQRTRTHPKKKPAKSRMPRVTTSRIKSKKPVKPNSPAVGTRSR